MVAVVACFQSRWHDRKLQTIGKINYANLGWLATFLGGVARPNFWRLL